MQTIDVTELLNNCEDYISDLFINITPYAPSEALKIRALALSYFERMMAPYLNQIPPEEIDNRIDRIESMYALYCKFNERVYGSFSA